MSNWQIFPLLKSEGKHCLPGGVHPHKGLQNDNEYTFKGVQKAMIILLGCYGKSEFENGGHEI